MYKSCYYLFILLHTKGLVKKYRGVGHEVLSLVQGVGRAIFSYS